MAPRFQTMSNRKMPHYLIRYSGQSGIILASLLVLASVSLFSANPAFGADPGVAAETGGVVSDQKAGSILIFNIYTSDATDIENQNTKFAITNTAYLTSVSVQVFMIDSLSGAAASFSFCLTQSQTISFESVDLDPNTEGYAIVVAIDSNGAPLLHNHLVGDLYIKFSSGHQAGLGAVAVAAKSVPAVSSGDSQVDLDFNGTGYDRLPLTLAIDNVPSRVNNNETILFINRAGGDLSTGVTEIGNMFGLLFNDAEVAHSFSLYSARSQFKITLNANNPRTTPRFMTVVPDGRSGWLKIYSVQNRAIIGAMLNFNSGTFGVPNSFSGGHNLHVLTTTSARMTIPVFPGICSGL